MTILNNKPRVWVLMGGTSSEREVSLRTGAGVAGALKEKGYRVEAFDIRPGKELLELNWSSGPDVVFIGLHGSFGEDGTLQGFLETLNVPYVGSNAKSSSLCFHKGLTKKIVSAVGVPVPTSIDIQGADGFGNAKKIGLMKESDYLKNWFIKPAREGSTVGIERHRGSEFQDSQLARTQFEEALQRALKYDSYVLIEEWVEGVEVTATVFEGQALPLVEIRPQSKFFDYKSKYTKGLTDYFCPAEIDSRLTQLTQEFAKRSFAALECRDYGRADFILGPTGPVFLEMNTLPGMTETSLVPKSARAAGIEYGEFCSRLVEAALLRKRSL